MKQNAMHYGCNSFARVQSELYYQFFVVSQYIQVAEVKHNGGH